MYCEKLRSYISNTRVELMAPLKGVENSPYASGPFGVRATTVKNQGPCQSRSLRQECQDFQLGYLVRMVSLHNLELESTWDRNLEDIFKLLVGIKTTCFPDSYDSHGACSWVLGLHRLVKETQTSIQGLALSDFPSSGLTGA